MNALINPVFFVGSPERIAVGSGFAYRGIG
jgi:hypothetical protein